VPHVIVKLYAGRSDREKRHPASEVTRAVTTALSYGEDSVSVGIEDVEPKDWAEQVYNPTSWASPIRSTKSPATIRFDLAAGATNLRHHGRWRSASTTRENAAEDCRRLG